MSEDHVLHIGMFWLALHFVLEKIKILLYHLYPVLYDDNLGCFLKVTESRNCTKLVLRFSQVTLS